MASAFLLPALALMAGAAYGTFSTSSHEAPAWLLPVCACSAIVAWRRGVPAATWLLISAGFALAGAALAADARYQALDTPLRRVLDREVGGFLLETLGPEQDHEPILTRARIAEDAALRSGFVSLPVTITSVFVAGEWVQAAGGVSLAIGGEAGASRFTEWTAGRSIEAAMTFRRPSRYLNDGVPDFERDLALDGTTLFGSVKSGLLVAVIATGTRMEERAARVRACVRRAVGRWVTPHHAVAGAIVTAVLIGDRTGVPGDVRERLQAAGTYHVIAISGGNIAVLAGLSLGLLMLAGVRGRLAAGIAIGVLVLYSQVAVAGPSVWRATLMAVVYLAARLLDQRTAPWQAAAVAVALMIVTRPLDIRDPGFILTCGATAALLEGARLGASIRSSGRVAAWIAGSVLASLAAEIALLPVSAQVFSRVTGAGVILNLLAVPAMAVAQVAGIVVVAFDAWEPLAAVAGRIASLAAQSIVDSAHLVEVLPGVARRVPPPGLVLLAVYYLALLCGVFAEPLVSAARGVGRAARARRVSFGARVRLWRRHHGGPRPMTIAALAEVSTLSAVSGVRRAASAVLLVCAAAICGVHPVRDERPAPSPVLRLTIFDVGQGEALLLQGSGGALQIDTGGAPFESSGFDIGGRVLALALWARGVASIDTLLLTHGDPDHMGGAAAVVDDFLGGELWEGILVPAHQPSRNLRERAAARQISLATRRAGEVLPWGSARIRVLHPPEPDWERPRIRNDDSVVLEIVHGDVAILLAGDISEEVERAIAPQLTSARIRILKVAHHGSRTSTSRALLDAWPPHVALISAGRGNTFGHPTTEVLERLAAVGASVYRTDHDGQITLETDGRIVRVRTYVGGDDGFTRR